MATIKNTPKTGVESPPALDRFQQSLLLETSITQARCFVDVLSELCLPGGDMTVGAMALETLGPEKLWSTLCVLEDLLKKVDDQFHALNESERMEIAA